MRRAVVLAAALGACAVRVGPASLDVATPGLARVAYATALHAEARGDEATAALAARRVAQVGGADPWSRLAAARLALGRGALAEADLLLAGASSLAGLPAHDEVLGQLRVDQGAPGAAAALAAAARARPWLWPDALAAAGPDEAAEVLAAWRVTDLPGWARGARAEALLRAALHAEAAADAEAAMAWRPTPEGLLRWSTAACLAGQGARVVAWVRRVGAASWSGAWAAAAEEAVRDPSMCVDDPPPAGGG